MVKFDDWLYEEVVGSREFFFGFIKANSVMAATIMRQRAIDAVKALSEQEGTDLSRVEEAIKNLKILGEED